MLQKQRRPRERICASTLGDSLLVSSHAKVDHLGHKDYKGSVLPEQTREVVCALTVLVSCHSEIQMLVKYWNSLNTSAVASNTALVVLSSSYYGLSLRKNAARQCVTETDKPTREALRTDPWGLPFGCVPR